MYICVCVCRKHSMICLCCLKSFFSVKTQKCVCICFHIHTFFSSYLYTYMYIFYVHIYSFKYLYTHIYVCIYYSYNFFFVVEYIYGCKSIINMYVRLCACIQNFFFFSKPQQQKEVTYMCTCKRVYTSSAFFFLESYLVETVCGQHFHAQLVT